MGLNVLQDAVIQTRGIFAAVSYTHLDVYKRQGEGYVPPQNPGGGNTGGGTGNAGSGTGNTCLLYTSQPFHLEQF